MKRSTRTLVFAGACLFLSSCHSSAISTVEPVAQPASETADGPNWFDNATESSGLDFIHDPGPTGTYFMPQSMGSGCAFIRDEDDTLYLYLLQNAGPNSKSVNRLYKRTASNTLEDVSAGSGLDVAGWSMGVAVGDVNNDGKPDVVLTQYGGIKLFLNLGGGKFENVSAEANLANPMWACSAAFLDYDRDGFLDLVVVNYVDYDPKRDCYAPKGGKDYCGPTNFKGTCSKLFRNLGAGKAASGKPNSRIRFEDVSFGSGIGRLPGPGLGVVCADFDGDGWQDILVANDGQANRLWINQKNGTFKDEALARGIAVTAMGKAFANMGIAVGDVDNDGMLDLYITHLNLETNTLWKQGPHGEFRDRTAENGLMASRWRATGFGTLMADFDLDGAVDIAVVNGRVFLGGPAANSGLGFWETYAERNQLFANDGSGKFRDISTGNSAFCGRWNVARGLACADFDGDGAPDLLVNSISGRAQLLRNVAANRGHWLRIRAMDPLLKRDAYGAEVFVRAGGRAQLRLINPAQSYLSSGDLQALYGLGKADRYDSILVRWPDGSQEQFPGGPADRAVIVRRGEGRKP